MDWGFTIFGNPQNEDVKVLSVAYLDASYECPAPVDPQQLEELHLIIKE